MVIRIFLLVLLYFPLIASAGTARDSIGVCMVNGQKYILHKVNKGETLFALNRKYQIPVDAIRKANPVKSVRIVAGDTLLIPFPENIPDQEFVKKETMQQADILPAPRNDTEREKAIADPDRQDKLQVKSKDINGINSETSEAILISRPDFLPPQAKYSDRKDLTGQPVLSVVLEGKVEIMTDDRMQSEPMYALHKDLPEGTFIKIINPVNQKFVIVRSLKPASGQLLNERVFLYISPIAARYLDVKADPDHLEMRFTLSGK